MTQPRHQWPDRLFHWAMALSVLVLLVSAFAPIAGFDFDWIPWHWISGVALGALVLAHIVRALFVQGISSMLPGRAKRGPPKYDLYQLSYHWVTALVIGVLLVSGALMLVKLDTPLWDRNPALLKDLTWGYVYVAHGIASLVLIFFTIVHVYFALLPEHRSLLRAMLHGGSPEPHAADSSPQEVADALPREGAHRGAR